MTAIDNAREGDGVAGLPPLPQEVAEVFAEDGDGYGWITPGKCYYTPDQMRAYALAAMQVQQGAEPVAWSYERLALFTSGNHDWLHALTVDDPRKNYPASEIRNVRALYPATGAPR